MRYLAVTINTYYWCIQLYFAFTFLHPCNSSLDFRFGVEIIYKLCIVFFRFKLYIAKFKLNCITFIKLCILWCVYFFIQSLPYILLLLLLRVYLLISMASQHSNGFGHNLTQ